MKMIAGMDLAGQENEYCVMEESGKIVKRGKIGWEPARWKRWVEEWKGEGLTVAFEAGPEAYRAQILLEKYGAETYPFHAAHFGQVSKSKRKTDRIDAKKICCALRGGGLPDRVVLAERELAILRNLISQRELYQKHLKSYRNAVSGLCRQWNVNLPPYRKEIAQQWWEEVANHFPKAHRKQVEILTLSALLLVSTLEQLGEEIQKQIDRSGMRENVELAKTIPGFGEIVSAAVVSYLGDGERFTRGRKFGAYTGMVPTVKQTGGKEARLGHITKEGPSVLRKLLVLAAHSATRSAAFRNSKLWEWYTRLQYRRGKKIAIVALGRKLAQICYAMIRDGNKWEPSRMRSSAA